MSVPPNESQDHCPDSGQFKQTLFSVRQGNLPKIRFENIAPNTGKVGFT